MTQTRETLTKALLWYLSPLSVVVQCAVALLVTHYAKARGADPVPVAWAWEVERAKAAVQPIPQLQAQKRYYRDAAGVYWELPAQAPQTQQAPGVAQPPFSVPSAPSTTLGTPVLAAGGPSTWSPGPGRLLVPTRIPVLHAGPAGTTEGCSPWG